jgi:hypothetical protein
MLPVAAGVCPPSVGLDPPDGLAAPVSAGGADADGESDALVDGLPLPLSVLHAMIENAKITASEIAKIRFFMFFPSFQISNKYVCGCLRTIVLFAYGSRPKPLIISSKYCL